MIKILEALEAAAQGNARLDKLKVLDSFKLRELLNWTLSPDITFGIKKLPKPDVMGNGFINDDEWYTELSKLLKKLSARALTGNKADLAVGRFLGSCSPLMLKWSERVLKRDLRLNIDAKSVNSVLPDTIKVFSVPLAESYEKAKSLEGLWVLQPKLDGARCVAYITGEKDVPVVLKSRTGKVWGNFESVRAVLQSFNDSGKVKVPLYLDGEVVSLVDGAINFQALQHTLHRKDGQETGKLAYMVFDGAEEKEWENPSQPYLSRILYAQNVVKAIDNPTVEALGADTIADPTLDNLTEYCKVFVSKGYEGAMIRSAKRPVVMKRSKYLLKVKIFKDLEATITGVVEGEGRLKGTLGCMKMRLDNGNEFECGSGFNDYQRALYWKDPPIGQLANVKYFELTNDRVPRFPIFRAIRHPDDV